MLISVRYRLQLSNRATNSLKITTLDQTFIFSHSRTPGRSLEQWFHLRGRIDKNLEWMEGILFSNNHMEQHGAFPTESNKFLWIKWAIHRGHGTEPESSMHGDSNKINQIFRGSMRSKSRLLTTIPLNRETWESPRSLLEEDGENNRLFISSKKTLIPLPSFVVRSCALVSSSNFFSISILSLFFRVRYQTAPISWK